MGSSRPSNTELGGVARYPDCWKEDQEDQEAHEIPPPKA
jgi:hypothetical protein